MIPNKTQFLSELQVIAPLSPSFGGVGEVKTNPNQSLRKFVELKAQIEQTKSSLIELEADAINEALDIHQDNMNNNKNNVIYQDSIAKVVICFRQKYVSSKDSPELAKLEELIRSEEIILLQKYGEKLNIVDSEIEELENQIKALEVRKEKLLSSKRIESLKAEYQQLIQKLAYKEPGLNVSFKQ